MDDSDEAEVDMLGEGKVELLIAKSLHELCVGRHAWKKMSVRNTLCLL